MFATQKNKEKGWLTPKYSVNRENNTGSQTITPQLQKGTS